MSVYKRCSSTDRRITRIRERVEYVFDKTKTYPALCHASGVSKERVYEDMVFVKQLFCKTDGRQYLHWVLSHDAGVSVDIADAVGLEVLELLKGKYQVIEATHINTSNIHTHYLINPVDIKTGTKFSESLRDMQRFREKINDILIRYKLSPIKKVTEVDENMLDEIEVSLADAEENEYTDDILELEQTLDDDCQDDNEKNEYWDFSTQDIGCEKNVNTERKKLIRGITYDNIVGEDMTSEKRTFNSGLRDMMQPQCDYPTLINKTILECTSCTFTLRSRDGFEGVGIIENGQLLVPGLLYEKE